MVENIQVELKQVARRAAGLMRTDLTHKFHYFVSFVWGEQKRKQDSVILGGFGEIPPALCCSSVSTSHLLICVSIYIHG